MIETDQQAPTFSRLAQRTISTCMGALGNRAELFALEFEEENDRMLKLLVFAFGGIFFAMMTTLLVTAIVIFLAPEEYRLWVAFGFAVLYFAGTVGAVLFVKNLLKQTPFSESLNQIRKDAELVEAFK